MRGRLVAPGLRSGPMCPFCRLVLVESIPQDLPSAAGSPSAQPLAQAWLQLLDAAQESIHVASFYWSLTGADIGVNDSSSQLVCPGLPTPLGGCRPSRPAGCQGTAPCLCVAGAGWPPGRGLGSS